MSIIIGCPSDYMMPSLKTLDATDQIARFVALAILQKFLYVCQGWLVICYVQDSYVGSVIRNLPKEPKEQ